MAVASKTRKRRSPESRNAIPDAVVCHCRCRECGSWLLRSSTAWLCPDGHGGLVGDDLLEGVLDAALADAGLRMSGKGVMNRLRWHQRRRERR